MFRKLLNIELGRPDNEQYRELKKTPFVIVLDNIRSQHNIGSAFRTSDAFLIDKIYLCGICAIPPSAEIHKSALGAEFSVNWEYYKDTLDLVKQLKSEGYTIISIEQTENSTPINNFTPSPNNKYALIFGNEVKGVQQDVVNQSDFTIEIPQFGTKHSLNVSVSIGIAAYSFTLPFLTNLSNH